MVRKKYNFDKKCSDNDTFDEQVVMDILKNVMYDYVKTARPYVEPTVQDAQKIEDKIKQENDEFLKRATDFNKFNIAATIKEEQFLW